jgi:hypothetical protein
LPSEGPPNVLQAFTELAVFVLICPLMLWLSFLSYDHHRVVGIVLEHGRSVQAKVMRAERRSKPGPSISVLVPMNSGFIERKLVVSRDIFRKCRPDDYYDTPKCASIEVLYLSGSRVDTVVKSDHDRSKWMNRVSLSAFFFLFVAVLASLLAFKSWGVLQEAYARAKAEYP